jgi:hypothetical protein
MTEPIRPSIWRNARRNTARSVSAVRIARDECQGCPPGVVRGSSCQPLMDSSVNQTVRLPRWRKLASYTRQLRSSAPSEFMSLCFCLGMWLLRCWFSLNGKMAIPGQVRAKPLGSAGSRRQSAGACDKFACGKHLQMLLAWCAS